jgi:hypothetical protein
MAEIRVIGHGLCKTCGSQTDIKEIHSFPFPGEEQTETVEECANCKSRAEKGFISSNATTGFDHSLKRDTDKA